MVTPPSSSPIDKEDISDFSRKATLSPATRVQFSLAKMVTGIVAIVVFTVAIFGGYSAVTHALQAHVENRDVHLEADYYRTHGQVIGQFDLTTAKAEIKERIDAQATGLRQDLDALRRELVTRDKRKRAE